MRAVRQWSCRNETEVGWLRGLEPPTSGITIQDSNQLSYSHHWNWNLHRIPELDPDSPSRCGQGLRPSLPPPPRLSCIDPSPPSPDQVLRGAPGRTRTCNHRLRRPVLYPVELRAPVRMIAVPDRTDGRGRGIRTPDILLPKQARYQTALYPGR